MNGQAEVIHFWATGGTGAYTFQLQGSVPPFMIPDWAAREISVEPTDCSHDPGTYSVSLVVSDSAGDTGKLNFTLNVAQALCARRNQRSALIEGTRKVARYWWPNRPVTGRRRRLRSRLT